MTSADIATGIPKATPSKLRKSGNLKRRKARIANAGREAQAVPAMAAAGTSTTPPPANLNKAPRVTKSATVIALLRREHGATLPELIKATGWLPHTTRAALTGFKKKGRVIAREKRGDLTCYRITPIPA